MKCDVPAWSQLIQLADGWPLSCNIELKVKGAADLATSALLRELNRHCEELTGNPLVISTVPETRTNDI